MFHAASLPGGLVMPQLVRITEAAMLLRCSRRTVWNRVAEGKLKITHNGAMALVYVSSILELLAG
jgi:hypothetical protein